MKALPYDHLCAGNIEARMKRRAACPHDAMVGPQNLRAIGEVDRLERSAAMGGGERRMSERMPVLGQDHDTELPGQTIDQRHHGVSIRHRKRSAGAKIILNVDDDQRVGGSNLDHCHRQKMASFRDAAKRLTTISAEARHWIGPSAVSCLCQRSESETRRSATGATRTASPVRSMSSSVFGFPRLEGT